MQPDWRKSLQTILEDSHSGSFYLREKLEKILPAIPDTEFADQVRKIVAVHSSMAALINLLNRESLRREGVSVEPLQFFDDKILRDFWVQPAGLNRWVTISNSYWVTRCLLMSPKKLQLKVGISYPDREGVRSAETLKASHHVELIEDGHLPLTVQESDGVIMGADVITPDAVVNKIGSFPLALAASHFNKPCFVISSGDKQLPAGLDSLYRPKTVTCGKRIIHYFEPVPRRMVTGIVWTTSTPSHPVSRLFREQFLKR